MSTNGRKPEPVYVVIVGASGGAAAKVLTEAGLTVVGLEKGPWLRPAEQFSGDEIKDVNRNYLWPDPKLTSRTVRDDDSSESELFPSPLPRSSSAAVRPTERAGSLARRLRTSGGRCTATSTARISPTNGRAARRASRAAQPPHRDNNPELRRKVPFQ